jgi:hypothetical protein
VSPIVDGFHEETFLSQALADQGAKLRVVVDDQYAIHSRGEYVPSLLSEGAMHARRKRQPGASSL